MAWPEMNRRSFLKGTAGGMTGAAASNNASVTLRQEISSSSQHSGSDPRDGRIFGH